MYNFLLKKYYLQKIPHGKAQRVAVGMSGGVDSSVTAAILKDRGYDVVGVFIKVWQPDFLTCSWKEDRRDAMRVCSQLGIPFKTINLEDVYKNKVVEYMVQEYKKGRTPNPDVMCNTFVKFGAFYEWAMENNFEYVATGHYARVAHDFDQNKMSLLKGVDNSKDQSYFIWQIQQEKLAHVLFPIGSILKKHVRSIAHAYKLVTASKKDSQGLCFLGHVDIGDFLSHFIDLNKGHVKDINGNIIGHHKGVALYTIGQRHGFMIEASGDSKPVLYVVKKDIESNTLVVSERPIATFFDNRHVPLRDVYLREKVMTGSFEKKYIAQIRYHGIDHSVRIFQKNAKYYADFKNNPDGLAAGQSLVLFNGDVCVGGGIIDEPVIK